MLIRLDDLSIRHEPKLDQRLEAVAYAAHEAVPLFQQSRNGILHFRIPEESRDKFGAAVRLIAPGEAAWNKDDLAFPHFLCESFRAAGNLLRTAVPDHKDLRFRTGIFYRPGAVVFTVRSGKSGNQHFWLCCFKRRNRPGFHFVQEGLRPILQAGLRSAVRDFHPGFPVPFRVQCGIHLLQPVPVTGIHLRHTGPASLPAEAGPPARGHPAQQPADRHLLRQFSNEGTVPAIKKLVSPPVFRESHTQSVAKAHLHGGSRGTADLSSPAGNDLSFPDQAGYLIKDSQQGFRLR